MEVPRSRHFADHSEFCGSYRDIGSCAQGGIAFGRGDDVVNTFNSRCSVETTVGDGSTCGPFFNAPRHRGIAHVVGNCRKPEAGSRSQSNVERDEVNVWGGATRTGAGSLSARSLSARSLSRGSRDGVVGAAARQQQTGEENNKAGKNVAESLHGCLRSGCFQLKYTTRWTIGQFPETPQFVIFLSPWIL